VWIQFEFTEPFRTRAFSLALAEWVMRSGEVQVSQDGAKFSTLLVLPGPAHDGAPMRTYSFPETEAKYYRLILVPPPAPPIVSAVISTSSSSLGASLRIQMISVA